ncbi:MAG TPA: hypothetical protein VNB86_02130 [Gaiellaceae bacterium]|nr:hypothetical protein [Gaiellaceae bacterium]
MNKADQLIDRAADGLRKLSDRVAAEGGVAAKLADPIAEDAAFLRKLKPSLIAARARGQAPTNQPAGSDTPAAPSRPQIPNRPKPTRSGGLSPVLVVGAALVAGVAIAKFIDWRGHAHPRD